MKKNNIITLCSGYDAMVLALKRLRKDFPQFKFDLLAWSEIDSYACMAHNALHPEFTDRAVGDMTKVDWHRWKSDHGDPKIDCLIYSTPCQSVSTAGKQAGMKKGDEDAASALIWYTEKAIEALRPTYLLLENVKGMVSYRNRKDFDEWCGVLEKYGYTNYWQVLNSKDYGVPQNRERVFMVSILGSDYGFAFPKTFPLEKRLCNVLEEKVDESYYLKEEQVARILAHCDRKVAEGCGFRPNFQEPHSVSGTITGNYGQRETDPYLKEYEENNPI